ncbi:MAG: hypothetical protein F4X35_12615 [Alphaproteobacteria bacterium]|nr:hypothetical protein [Alphaproteobacteria bacterium]
MAPGDRERRSQRTITATDTEWRQIAARAKRAGLPISRFVVRRLTEPVEDAAPGLSRQAAVDLRVLVKIEQGRLREHGPAGAWDGLVSEAEAEVDGEEALG